VASHRWAGTDPLKNILTIDVEDWYQLLVDEFDRWDSYTPRVEGATHYVLDILSEYGVKATWFVLGYVAERFPELIRDIHQRGHEVGTHGHSHQFLQKQSPETFRAELVRSLDVLSRLTGEKILGHRASSFTVNEKTQWALEILESEGLTYDSSISPTRNFFYGWPDAPRYPYPVEGLSLVEFPASTVEFLKYRAPVAGGFALRLFPYGFTRRVIRNINERGHPAVVYLHPWELDLDQPRLPLSPAWRFLRYYGLGSTEKKLRRLLQDFEFAPMGEFVDDYRR